MGVSVGMLMGVSVGVSVSHSVKNYSLSASVLHVIIIAGLGRLAQYLKIKIYIGLLYNKRVCYRL